MKNEILLLKEHSLAITRISYFVISTITIGYLLYDKYSAKPIEQPQPPQAVVIDTKPIENAQKEIETLKQLDAKRSDQIKQLEQRLQTHLEFNKRLCEYIFVITVDRKIVPRQCLSDYKWNKE
jgi:hypothetical protein